ncbi:MAG: helix-turn-helix domain-containing protein [Sneathiella sp.]
MTGSKSYRLLCPIARALDRVGDRWTLLILRDLHAGPARFSDLQAGLKGMASNLLTSRLGQLIEDGFAEKREADFNMTLYALTELGKKTAPLLFELALLGGHLTPAEDIREPGNLRTVAVTLQAACQRVAPANLDLRASLVIEGEEFALTVAAGTVSVLSKVMVDPDIRMTTAYEPMIDVSDGRLALDLFVKKHASLEVFKEGADQNFMILMGDAIGVLQPG